MKLFSCKKKKGIQFRVKEGSGGILPQRATSGSAGYDLHIPTDEHVVLTYENNKVVVDTGVYIDLPEGYYADMRIRSSLGIKKHVRLMNSTGVIDSDFKDTIKIPLHLYDVTNDVTIEAGDRVAQIIILKHEYVDGDGPGINDNKRTGGIGSTGEK